MTEQQNSLSDDYACGATWWAVVLSDWRRAGADVTLTTRGGVQLGPGRIERMADRGLGSSVQLVGTTAGRLTKWDVDLTEVVAVQAVAR